MQKYSQETNRDYRRTRYEETERIEREERRRRETERFAYEHNERNERYGQAYDSRLEKAQDADEVGDLIAAAEERMREDAEERAGSEDPVDRGVDYEAYDDDDDYDYDDIGLD